MRRSLCALFLGLTFATIPAARAELILDTTANKSAPLAVPSSSSSLATGPKGWTFTVVGGPWTITDVTWGLYGNASGTANVGVRLYSGAETLPEFVLEDTGTTNLSLNTIGTAQYYDWTGLSWALAAGTYTVAAYGATDTVTPRIATTTNSMVTGTGVSVIGPTESDNNYAVLVQGTSGAAPVPEPGTWAAAALLAAGATFARWRRGKAK